jgi:hypothetical protein
MSPLFLALMSAAAVAVLGFFNLNTFGKIDR